MKLFAISDIHVGYPENRQAIVDLPPHLDDWLIVAGDVGDTIQEIADGLQLLQARFAQLIWVPGNHDLWTIHDDPGALRGVQRYETLVELCRVLGVLTPEDPYAIWSGEGPRCVLAPLFLLYDYSFRPNTVPAGQEIAWAMETEIYCSDETYLHAEPFASKPAWCAARCDAAYKRLSALDPSLPTVLINHFPLRSEDAWLPAIPRFSIWCGTRRTEDWHRQFRALAVVYGHLHFRASKVHDQVRFEEVSLGYPRHWKPNRGLQPYLREILPGPHPCLTVDAALDSSPSV